MKFLTQDLPVLAAASTSGAGWGLAWLDVLNPVLEACASIVAIVAGVATVWMTVERIRKIRQDRNDSRNTHKERAASREDSSV